ncbi:MAG: glycosyltransferase [Alistipes sp.]|jgi:CDP-glycerol glycerophosphotransferase|nr:glycosyltransferase [Alistipes sp.]
MKVSVVIPVYNGEKYLAACLDGMMRQTHRDLEIIVVDDGSGDRSPEIARSYPVKVVAFERNRGLSAARNAGMAAATGEYLHFMDVDDEINDEFYERLAAAALATGADVACCGMVHEPKPHRTTLFSERRVIAETREKFRVTKAGVWSYVWRYLFRRSFLTEHGLSFEEGRLVEDMPFTVPAIYHAAGVVVVPGAEYTYKLNEGSIMQVRSREHRRRRHRDLRHAKELRHNFARAHGFSIPGVPTWAGPLSLLYVKWLT